MVAHRLRPRLRCNRSVSARTSVSWDLSVDLEDLGEFWMVAHKVVSHDEWVGTRKKHLAKEKEFTHLRDQLSRERRELPWELVEKDYTFEDESGKVSLQNLFDGRSQ